MSDDLSKQPSPDPAEFNAYFPSPYSLGEFTSPTTPIDGAEYPDAYQGSRKVLVIAADERYLPTDTGKLFSTGNHPVETLVPMYHLHQAGFGMEVATLSGNPSSSKCGPCRHSSRRSRSCTAATCPNSCSRADSPTSPTP
ncbi:hypothetical protein V8Z74_04750 [Comamonas sp. w2-DMI]|uniref:hypothetical protein n=1 Tax=Comamonas sp. w2-DMI TaxID=3126391 RepID=UPI0032E377AF